MRGAERLLDRLSQQLGIRPGQTTADGRIKPDVVAPGTWTLSGYSDLYQQLYDPAPNAQNGRYQYDGWGAPADAACRVRRIVSAVQLVPVPAITGRRPAERSINVAIRRANNVGETLPHRRPREL